MVPYLVLIILPCVCFLPQINAANKGLKIDNKRLTKRAIDIFFFLFLLLLILRNNEVGIDLKVYEAYYINDIKLGWKQIANVYNVELGYKYLEKIVGLFTGDFNVFKGIIALISIIPIWKFYRERSDYPMLIIALVLTVFPFTMYFSGLRQITAMAFAFLAWHFAENKKIVLFIISCIVAFFFHSSAFIILLIYPLYWIRFNRKSFWILAVLFALLVIFNSQIFIWLASIFGGAYETKYGGIQLSSTGGYSVLILLVFLFICSFLFPKIESDDVEANALRNILIIATFLQTFAMLNSLAMRLNYYFLIFVPISVTKMISKSDGTNKKYFKWIGTLLVVFLFGLFLYKGIVDDDPLNIFPYKFIWD